MTYDTQDNAEKMRLENKYRASQNLRASLDYDAFATSARDARDDGAGMFGGTTTISHSGWLLKRYQTDGPEVVWKRRWFYLLDDRL